jgi:PPE-repeat protein
MVLDFSWLPPEINSARIFAGAGSGPLHMAATAWDGLAQDLSASASSFESVVTALASGPWSGPASVSMAAAAMPYVSWLSAAAGQAASAAAQALAAATAFEVAHAATVHPLAVTGNRTTLATLLATNFFGINLPAIAATEFQYVEMWAQDVGAMLGYHAGATSVASTLAPFSIPPVNLAGLSSWAGQFGTAVMGAATHAGSQLASVGTSLSSGVASAVSAIPGAVTSVESAVSGLPLSSLSQVAQIGMYPASMMMSPMMSLMQMANGSSGGLPNAAAMGAGAAADVPKLAGDAMPAGMKGLGGAGGLGAGLTGELGKARLVGAMSVPPTWEGSMPARMASSAMSGLGPGLPAAEMAAAAGATGASTGGGMPMMPMPMGMGGAGAGMQGGMMGRGGASPHVLQNRPSVVPRTGIG